VASDIVRITELERQVESLKLTVESLVGRQALSAAGEPQTPDDAPHTLAQVVQLTEQLFPGAVSVEVLNDPESPCETFIVLNVETHGEPQELIERQCEWHERVAALANAEAGSYRLSIDPRP
jgi:hypothetical protein